MLVSWSVALILRMPFGRSSTRIVSARKANQREVKQYENRTRDD